MKVYISASVAAGDDVEKIIAHSLMVAPDTVKRAQDDAGRKVYVVDLSTHKPVAKVVSHAHARLVAGLKRRYLEHILEGTTLKVFVRNIT